MATSTATELAEIPNSFIHDTESIIDLLHNLKHDWHRDLASISVVRRIFVTDVLHGNVTARNCYARAPSVPSYEVVHLPFPCAQRPESRNT